MKKVLIIAIVVVVGLSIGCKKDKSGINGNVKYEKILGLELTRFGNSMIVYSGGSNTYDLIFSNNRTYTKKKWSDRSTVSGTWSISGNELRMDETGGTGYTLTANAEGIVKDGMSVFINNESGIIVGLFNEMIGTGSGVLDMGYTNAIGKYRVDLLGDIATIVLTFNNGEVNIKRVLLSGGIIEDNNYNWTFNGYDVLFTKIGTNGAAQDISKINEQWWIEGSPINLYFISDASYVGYMVSNIDYLGE
ncbi:MAG: hypothetical protein CVU00_09675 [Bacteroidetes bacterium HGW-Bacteroidetes-17]|nr:MAG: hypothetical protein CVU00_09675 [Bacteroidetes bacterium HGW-Bacteroidetes-17]